MRTPNLLSESRRNFVKTAAISALGGASVGITGFSTGKSAEKFPLPRKKIPSTGEELPAVGLGSTAFASTTRLRSALALLRRMIELGGSVVDTAARYGPAEDVIGQLVSRFGDREKLFLSTKVSAPETDTKQGIERSIEMMERSFTRLQTDRIDLMQIYGWSNSGGPLLMPVLLKAKEAGRLRYVGVDGGGPDFPKFMHEFPLDFVQFSYSIDYRVHEPRLSLAQDLGIAVLAHRVLGSTNDNLSQMRGKPPPPWAAEFGMRSWAEIFVKHAISHPAITCVVIGTKDARHLEEDMLAACGALPNLTERRKMEMYWDLYYGSAH